MRSNRRLPQATNRVFAITWSLLILNTIRYAVCPEPITRSPFSQETKQKVITLHVFGGTIHFFLSATSRGVDVNAIQKFQAKGTVRFKGYQYSFESRQLRRDGGEPHRLGSKEAAALEILLLRYR